MSSHHLGDPPAKASTYFNQATKASLSWYNDEQQHPHTTPNLNENGCTTSSINKAGILANDDLYRKTESSFDDSFEHHNTEDQEGWKDSVEAGEHKHHHHHQHRSKHHHNSNHNNNIKFEHSSYHTGQDSMHLFISGVVEQDMDGTDALVAKLKHDNKELHHHHHHHHHHHDKHHDKHLTVDSHHLQPITTTTTTTTTISTTTIATTNPAAGVETDLGKIKAVDVERPTTAAIRDGFLKINRLQTGKQLLEDAFDYCEFSMIGNRIKVISVDNTAGFVTVYIPNDLTQRKEFTYNLSFCLKVDICLGKRAPFRCNLYIEDAKDSDDEREMDVTLPAVGNLTDFQTHQILGLSRSYKVINVITKRMKRFQLLIRQVLLGENIELPPLEDSIDRSKHRRKVELIEAPQAAIVPTEDMDMSWLNDEDSEDEDGA